MSFVAVVSVVSKHLWRNRLARSAVNQKVAGSSPARCEHMFFVFFSHVNFLICHRGLGRDVKPRGGGFCQEASCRTHEATSGKQTLAHVVHRVCI